MRIWLAVIVTLLCVGVSGYLNVGQDQEERKLYLSLIRLSVTVFCLWATVAIWRWI